MGVMIGVLVSVVFLSYCGWRLFLGFYEGEVSERTWKLATMTANNVDLGIFRNHRTKVKLTNDLEERVQFEYLIPAKELEALAADWDKIAARNGLVFVRFGGERDCLSSLYEDKDGRRIAVTLARRGGDVRMTIDKPRMLAMD